MTETTHLNPARAQTKRAVMYLRAASREPGDLADIETQRAACEQLARWYGLEITHEYLDTGRSGREIWRLLADLDAEPRTDYVLVDRVARLTTRRSLGERVWTALRSSDTSILSADAAIASANQNETRSLCALVIARLSEQMHGRRRASTTPPHLRKEV